MKAVLVTGLTSGIGRETALRFARAGYRVFGIGRDRARLDAVGAELTRAGAPEFKGFTADLGDERSLNELGETLSREVRELGALVCSAGIGDRSTLADTTLEMWEKTYRVNVTAPFWITRALLPALERGGPAGIVYVSSIAGRRRSATLGAQYSSSKAALLGLTRHLAAELGPRGIRVNAVAPSQTLTPLLEAAMTPDEQRALASRIPLRRLARAEDIAETIFFLAGETAAYVNGACLDVHGGQ